MNNLMEQREQIVVEYTVRRSIFWSSIILVGMGVLNHLHIFLVLLSYVYIWRLYSLFIRVKGLWEKIFYTFYVVPNSCFTPIPKFHVLIQGLS